MFMPFINYKNMYLHIMILYFLDLPTKKRKLRSTALPIEISKYRNITEREARKERFVSLTTNKFEF